MRGREWHLQYERLHAICFGCGKYGHRELHYPLMKTMSADIAEGSDSQSGGTSTHRPTPAPPKELRSSFGSRMVAQKTRCRMVRMPATNFVALASAEAPKLNGRDKGQKTCASRSNKTGQTAASTGSCFSILNDQDERPGVSATDTNDEGKDAQTATVTTSNKGMGSSKGQFQ